MDIRNEIEEIEGNVSEHDILIAAQIGMGGFVKSFDFGVSFPNQEDITDYVRTQIPGFNDIDRPSTDIFNGTRVTNDFDGYVWVLANTPDTDPPVFSWERAGRFSVTIANNSIAGVVRFTDETLKISGNLQGVQEVNGLKAILDNIDDEIADLEGNVRVPVTIKVEAPSSNVRLNIDVPNVGRQAALTDVNGEFSTSFKAETNYTVSINQRTVGANKAFPVANNFTTGTLNLPLEINIDTVLNNLADTEWFDDIVAKTALNSNAEYNETSLFGNLPPSNLSKWVGGVLAPNGKIYGIPLRSTSVLEIDPVTRTISTFGNLPGSAKWYGGVLAPNGKIYGIPRNSTSVLEIDPMTRTVSTFGNLPGSDKWYGGVLAPNGKIYGMPLGSTGVLEIDPMTRTASTFGSIAAGTLKYAGGVLAPNGKIYGIPLNSTSVLEIDPVTRTVFTFGNLPGTLKYAGGVLAPNGKIYGIPVDSTSVLEIDTVTRTVSAFGNLSGTAKWYGGVLAPNGKIYGIPFVETRVLEIGFDDSLPIVNFASTSYRSAWGNKI
jgi:streptogramin lyase